MAATPTFSRSGAWEFRADRRASAARRWPVQARSRPRPDQHAPGPDPDLRRQRAMRSTRPGNLGTGKRYFATLTIDAPLGRLWKGLRAKFNGTLQRTRVDDPISGKPRKFSGFLPRLAVGRSSVRRDAGAFSYGFDDQRQPALHLLPHRRVRHELQPRRLHDRLRRISPEPAETRSRFDVDNVLNTHAARDRLLFFPNRAECRTTSSMSSAIVTVTAAFGLTLKQSFGGRRGGEVGWSAAKSAATSPDKRGIFTWASLPSCRSTGRIRSTSISS